MKTLTLATILLLLSSPATADEGDTRIYLGGYSAHLWDTHLDSVHDMTLFDYSLSDGNSLLAGRFTNSHGRETYALAHGWTASSENWRVGFYVGANYGYRGCYNDDGNSAKACFMVVPAVSYTRYRVEPTAFVLGSAFVFSLGLQF